MGLILRYFTEFVYNVVKKFTFAISSPDEFLSCMFVSLSVSNFAQKLPNGYA